MTDDHVQISRKELSSDEILHHLDEGRRVTVTIGTFGIETEVTLRKNDREYVCDTGFKLLTYTDRNEMKRCIERIRLSASNR